MTKKTKRLERIRQNPKNVSFDELRQVLEDYDFSTRSPKGSHYIFKTRIGEKTWRMTIPYRKPHINEVYVKKAVSLIDAIIALRGEDDDEHGNE